MSGEECCANCGHTNHEDALQNDFCYKVTAEGLCGCESWEPVEMQCTWCAREYDSLADLRECEAACAADDEQWMNAEAEAQRLRRVL